MQTEIAILLKYLKMKLDVDLKRILSDYQNNYVRISSITSMLQKVLSF